MRSFTLAIAALILLSSCTDDPEPIEPKQSPSATPAATAPALPKSARMNTPAGAANFVKFWIDVSNFSAQTGDTALLKELSGPACDGCKRYIELYESIYSRGGYIRGGERSIGDVDLEVGKPEIYVRGKVSAAAAKYRNEKSGPELKSEADVTTIEFAATFDDQQWQMTQLGLAEKS